jgi:hormone-sensitive lipase
MDPVSVKAIILHIHGGGFIGGSSASSRATTIEYSIRLGVPVFSIDYRLSPDNKFPCALNDCWQVYLWLLKYSEKYLKLKPLKIILTGDSAGGNL